MINEKQNPVEWALIIMELDEAKEHIESLVSEMTQMGGIEESILQVKLFHAITHLNRIWNRRNHLGEVSDQESECFSKTPIEFKPIG